MRRIPTLAVLSLMLCCAAHAADKVKPGELVIEPPTLHCLGFEWPISGDDNRNATVAVQYRAKGAADWRQALPMLRIGGEKAGMEQFENMAITPHMFAGSIFDLDPGAAYEVKLTMADPDGGGAAMTVTTTTKSLPAMPKGGRTLNVVPAGMAIAMKGHVFNGLQKAFDAAKPGDTILIHPGEHIGHYVVKSGGTADKPIMIRGQGKAVLINDKHREMFDIHEADYLWFDNLTFRDPENGDGGHTVNGVVLLAGNRSHNITPGCKGLVVTHCRFEDFGVGIMAADSACRGFTITDNWFMGRQKWTAPKGVKAEGGYHYNDYSYVAAWMAGAGHDVAYNFVRGFRDGINICGGWEGEGFDPERKNVSIDFYNNDITEVGDDFMETEPGAHNIRVYRNRCTNTQTCGISAQPTYGGPIYILRNTLYNCPRQVPLKFNVHPTGLLVYHNTFVTPWNNSVGWSNGHFRNNIFMGTMKTSTLTAYSTMDYDAFMAGPVTFGLPAYGWASKKQVYLNTRDFADLKAFTAATGFEQHAQVVDFSIFEKLEPGLGKKKTYKPTEPNFTLNKGAPVVDAGCVLPNINDGFVGEAPDLGALELGAEPVHYGPRPRE